MENTRILDLLDKIRKRCDSNNEALMDEFNISLAELNFFKQLEENAPISCEIVANTMNLSLSRVSRIIDKLVANGLVLRKTNKIDRRAIDLKLTTKGKEVHQRIFQTQLNCENNIRQKLSEKESQELIDSLHRIISLL